MIVKNEEDVLARALDSVKELADEIIIVDTGSEDRTKDIARHYTQKVFDFEWEDDFAAARNFACRKASMDYWMWLDADDIVTENELKKMKALKSEIDPDTDVVMMKYLTGFDRDGYPAVSYYRERWLRNGKGCDGSADGPDDAKPAGRPVSVAVMIGPEGGFSDEEAKAVVEAGGLSVSLGKTTLRTETAGLAAIAMIMYELEL